MPAENLQDESLEKNPNLDLAQWKYSLQYHEPANQKLKQDLLDAINKDGKTYPKLFPPWLFRITPSVLGLHMK